MAEAGPGSGPGADPPVPCVLCGVPDQTQATGATTTTSPTPGLSLGPSARPSSAPQVSVCQAARLAARCRTRLPSRVRRSDPRPSSSCLACFFEQGASASPTATPTTATTTARPSAGPTQTPGPSSSPSPSGTARAASCLSQAVVWGPWGPCSAACGPGGQARATVAGCAATEERACEVRPCINAIFQVREAPQRASTPCLSASRPAVKPHVSLVPALQLVGFGAAAPSWSAWTVGPVSGSSRLALGANVTSLDPTAQLAFAWTGAGPGLNLSAPG
jgi:hypothetical protein